MDKHTPGPWEIRESKEGEGVCIYAGKYGIGKVWDLNGNPENEDNARLIAAAPDMLAALKAILSHKPDYADAIWDQVEDAIAKAEGPSTRRDGPVLREGVENV